MLHYLPSLKLDVFNIVSIPRVVTLANQVVTINVTETVSVELEVVMETEGVSELISASGSDLDWRSCSVGSCGGS